VPSAPTLTVVRRGALLPAAGVLLGLLALPAAAHPNAVSQELRRGVPTTITLLLLPDEGPVSGFDVTVPAGFRLTRATGDSHLPTVTTAGAVVRFRAPAGVALSVPDQAFAALDGTPTTADKLTVHILAQRVGQPPFDYGQVPVSAPAAPSSGPAGRAALTVGLLLAGGLVAAVAALSRSRRARGRLPG